MGTWTAISVFFAVDRRQDPDRGRGLDLNDPSGWYTSPIGTIAHLSEFALVFTDRDDANADLEQHRAELPEGTRVRAFSIVVEEIHDDHEIELAMEEGDDAL